MMYALVEVTRDRSLTSLIDQSWKQLKEDTLWLEEHREVFTDSPWFDLVESSLEEQQRQLAELYLERFEERRNSRPPALVDPNDAEVDWETAVDRIVEVISRGLGELTAIARRAN